MAGVRAGETRSGRYCSSGGYCWSELGMYKDQIYFMGAINVLRNRHKLNFRELHCGKINVEDCLRLSEKGQVQQSEKTKLPLFMKDLPLYLRCMDHIAEFNEIK